MHKFKKTNPENLTKKTYSGKPVLALESTNIDHALFLGRVITLFGEPDYTTDNYENAFSCAVEAIGESGDTVFLEIYYGPSGPAVSSPIDEDCSKTVEELTKLILSAEPADYDWEGVYEDIPVNIKMGVKNGEPYYESEMSEDMF